MEAVKQIRVGLDVDDVLADFIGRHAAICRMLFDKPAKGELPTDWVFSNYGLSKDQLETVWRYIRHQRNFWLSLYPRDFYTEIPQWVQPFFITSRLQTAGDSVEVQTAQWISETFHVPWPCVIVTHTRKGAIVAALELDTFVDDKPENCEDVAEKAPNCRVFLQDSSHNQSFRTEGTRIERVKSLGEVWTAHPGNEVRPRQDTLRSGSGIVTVGGRYDPYLWGN